MQVLHVAAEIFPLIKTGGLADVVGALPQALLETGTEARVLLPGLPAILNGVSDLRPLITLGPAFGAAVLTLYRGHLPGSGVVAYVIDAPFLYRRPGNPYLGPDGRDWPDNHRRFALLGWTAAHLASGELDPEWIPDIVHAHDWHAGLAPAFIAQNPALTTGTVFTIHNLAFRGLFPLSAYPDLGLPAYKLTPQGLEFHSQISFLKAGLVYSNRITTVSPTYAREICTPEFGWGLDGVLRDRQPHLSGILNGVDTAVWDPTHDQTLIKPFSANKLAGKSACKAALQAEYGLPEKEEALLLSVVSRLSGQKGLDLVLGAVPEIIASGSQLIVLGTGEAELEHRWLAMAAAHPDSVAVHIGYDEARSHRIIAGADVMLVPSRFEPCGLTQLYALRYGTLPLVRKVGGLADTVVDASPDNLLAGRATGFVFRDASSPALAARLQEATQLFQDKKGWKALQKTAMAQDFSWTGAARHYNALYAELSGHGGQR